MNKGILLLAIILLGAGCTTQKKRGDLKGLKKLYDNMTSQYNGYFNANVIMENTFAQLNQQHQDNYGQLLEVYPYLANANPQAVAPQMDTAMKKVSIVVNMHRKSDWVDDCYLLVGKAQFLKQDYESAEATFRYLTTEYNPYEKKKKRSTTSTAATTKEAAQTKNEERKETAKEKEKEQERIKEERIKRAKKLKKARARYNKAVRRARKKGLPIPQRSAYGIAGKQEGGSVELQQPEKPETEKERQRREKNEAKKKKKEEEAKNADPNKKFLRRDPAYHEGVLWLAKTYAERDNYDASQRVIKQLLDDTKTPDDVRSELPPLQAYLNLKQKKQDFAIQNMEQAVEMAEKRADQARYAFILAQLYQKAGRSDAAYTAFEQVLKYSNNYEMEFTARLNMAQNAWASGKGTSNDAVANLEKMLKDDKNAEYKDQVYYAIASIAMKAGDREKGIEYLKLSLQQPSENRVQRAETYLTLAQLFYEEESYIAAKNYYDSTLQVMPNTDERYAEASRLSKNLENIAKNLEAITLQDSLLRIGNMSEEERKAFAANIKKEREDAAAAQVTQATQPAKTKGKVPTAAAATQTVANVPALQKTSAFFAYDEKKVRQGKRDFQRKWGDRPLEDNWRRSNRQSTGPSAAEQVDSVAQAVASISNDDVITILRGVPVAEEAKKVANIKIREAMLTLGVLYRDRLQNNKKTVEVLEELNRRYPGHGQELDSWYYTYLAYKDLKNASKMQEYADKITSKYAGTNYAKVILDPSYVVEIENEERRLQKYYDEAYAAFKANNFQDAYARSTQAAEKFGATNKMQAKFALLTALCIGNLKGKDEYIASLNEVIAKYNNTEEQKYAREVLRLLGASTGAAALPGVQAAEEVQFDVQDDQVHSVIIALADAATLNDAKNFVSDFNKKYHDLEKLRVSDVFLVNGEARTPLIVIRRFKDKADAMRYYEGVNKNKKDFIPEKLRYELYPISQANYGKLFSTVKSVDVYRAFFEGNY